ncbi:flagellar biosynthesis regulator FlaF [Pseudooceanicola sp. C21-150M6]|uniref:flagellar biosynthesis regulator FlaF n=1 Tax=Pseudooceanicola sp. C21-150M6 TaxID=3434355 RepID=UPI003D7F7008
MSIAAYKRTIRESETPRQIERRVFVRVTNGIAEIAKRYDAAADRQTRADILATELQYPLIENQKLWSTIKHDLMLPDNGIPPQLKAGLISLALFVERQTAMIVGGNGNAGVLVQINESIIAGLTGDAPGPRG